VHLARTELNRTQREEITLKRTQLLVLSVLALGLQGVAQASPVPADAEASYNVRARMTHADFHAGELVSARAMRAHDVVAFCGNLDD
jgi:hypothetical protein